jgi:DNA mismatch repair protein MutS2
MVGVVKRIKNGRAELMAGPLRLDVPVEQLLETRKTAPVAVPPADTSSVKMRESVPNSLEVRGMNVDEALPLTELYLDKAYRAGHTSVMIIHGRGEGILRREVHALCSALRYVSCHRLGGAGEGGYGATIVEFEKR